MNTAFLPDDRTRKYLEKVLAEPSGRGVMQSSHVLQAWCFAYAVDLKKMQ